MVSVFDVGIGCGWFRVRRRARRGLGRCASGRCPAGCRAPRRSRRSRGRPRRAARPRLGSRRADRRQRRADHHAVLDRAVGVARARIHDAVGEEVGVAGGPLIDEQRSPRPPAQLVECGVGRDPVQPRAERGVPVEAGEAADRRDHRVLGRVGGVGVVAEQVAADREHAVVVVRAGAGRAQPGRPPWPRRPARRRRSAPSGRHERQRADAASDEVLPDGQLSSCRPRAGTPGRGWPCGERHVDHRSRRAPSSCRWRWADPMPPGPVARRFGTVDRVDLGLPAVVPKMTCSWSPGAAAPSSVRITPMPSFCAEVGRAVAQRLPGRRRGLRASNGMPLVRS